MAIRMSGLSSGLDTEAIVGALMSAQSLKKTKLTIQLLHLKEQVILFTLKMKIGTI